MTSEIAPHQERLVSIIQSNFKVTMKQTSFSIAIVSRKSRKDPLSVDLFARITYNGRRNEFSINRTVDLSIWDKRAGRAKGYTAHAKKLNTKLIELKADLLQAYEELRSEQALITPQLIKARFLKQDESTMSLITAFEYHNREVSKTLSKGTAKHYQTSLSYVRQFLEKEMKVEDILLSRLSYAFITRYELFLRTYQPIDHQKAPGNNTIMKHIQRLRKVVTLSVKLEWLEKDPFAKYKCKFTPSTRRFLSEDELARIENLDHLVKRLEYIRDLFVFSCYTGLVYIDTMNLTDENLVLGIDGSKWIHTSRQKSSQPVRLMLLPKAEAIIEKYRTHPKSLHAGTLFPKISNQRLNAYLKEIANLAEIDTHLTFHVGRHTFATTVALMNGLPIETLSKVLGHSKITTTQMYAKVLNQKVSSDMSNLMQVIQSKGKKAEQSAQQQLKSS